MLHSTKQTKNLIVATLIAVLVIAVAPLYAKDSAAQKLPGAMAVSVAKIDINKAGLEELESVKGIGPALAERIIAYRNENGKFKNIQDITSVKGIGQSKFERIKEQLIVS